MKKTRILIPALAMIAFSTAASIAGSVAWFTASRTVNVNAGTYAVVKTSANLDCVATAGIGTTASVVSDIQTISLGNNVLTDGSFNQKAGTIYQPNEAGDGIDTTVRDETKIKGEVTLAEAKETPALLERGQVTDGKVYTAVTFHLQFTIKFGGASGDYGLFLDCYNNDSPAHTGSTFTTTGTAYTAKGFRMAFYPTATSGEHGRATVFADLQDGGTWNHDKDTETPEVNKIRYVASSSNFVGTDYAASDYDLINSVYNTQLPEGSVITEAQAQNRPDYLGYFAYAPNQSVNLNLDVVCWFEGTDPEIVNRSTADEYQSVAADLHFEAVKLKAA